MTETDVEIPYGLAATGRMLHISKAERGLACGCVCAQCGQPLIARQGDVKRWHFAHQGDAACRGAYETAIHRAAKQIIADAALVLLPEIRTTSGREIDRHAVTAVLADVRQEPTHLPGIRPDLSAKQWPEGDELLIEILVTHAVDAEKQRKLVALAIPTVEIDLRDCGDAANPERLRAFVLRAAPRQWIFHPRIEELAAEHARAIAARKIAAAERRQITADAAFPGPTTFPGPDARARIAEYDARRCHFCGSDQCPFGYGPPLTPIRRWTCMTCRDAMEQLIAASQRPQPPEPPHA